MTTRKYRNIGLHETLVNEIESIIEETNYRSVSDFVHDACRRRLESLISLYPELKTKINLEKEKELK